MDNIQLIESAIWVFMPLVLVGLSHLINRKCGWQQVGKLYYGALALGLLSTLIAPSCLCTSVEDILVGSVLFSVVIYSVILALPIRLTYKVSEN
jgi:hypothetical protein